MPTVNLRINGTLVRADIEARTLLVELLREHLGLTGTHVGCDTSQCGACVVHVEGQSVKSCTMFAVEADGASVTTIEGVARDGELHPLQAAFREHHALQCGFCTPGMVMSTLDLVSRQPTADERQIRTWLEGNFCRCTGYHNIVKRRAGRADTHEVSDGERRDRRLGRAARKIAASSRARASYTDDLQRPRQTYAQFVRSPYAHARIRSVDDQRGARGARRLMVLTGADLAAEKIGEPPDRLAHPQQGRHADGGAASPCARRRPRPARRRSGGGGRWPRRATRPARRRR